MAEAEKKDDVDDAAVDSVLAEFNGDARAAIKALLHDVDVLARDFNSSVSHGFVRSKEREVTLRIEPT